MLNLYGPGGVSVADITLAPESVKDCVWIDCINPSVQEEAWVEQLIKSQLPTREEMRGLEVSSLLTEEAGVLTMTTVLISKSDGFCPQSEAVTFLLSPRFFVSLRYSEYASFTNFGLAIQKRPGEFSTPDKVFAGLLEHIIGRLSDILEEIGLQIEQVSLDLFDSSSPAAAKSPKLSKTYSKPRSRAQPKNRVSRLPRNILNRLGAIGNLDGKVREALVGLQRLHIFLNDARTAAFSSEVKSQLIAARVDLQALSEHSYFLADKTTFLLDATLGIINIEQNDIIRIFSIAAVMFMPPTLIASIYGMNFKFMHELEWKLGYEYAIVLMILSTLIPYLFFKKKGWM
jgi:magnesium transporter